jgi:uncharacterized protein YkwD
MQVDETAALSRRVYRRAARIALGRVWIAFSTSALALGCSDGVGRPLRAESGLVAGSAGSNVGGSSTGGSGLAGEGGGSGAGGKIDVPLNSYCAPAEAWLPNAAYSEEALLSLINLARARGASCYGNKLDPERAVPDLIMQKELRCSARVHVRDMVLRDSYRKVNAENETPEDRMRRAGAEFAVSSEVILVPDSASQTAEEAVASALLEILFDEDKCEDALEDRFANVGIGYYEGRWTLDFTGPET